MNSPKFFPLLAFIVAFAAISGSLYYSEILYYYPCSLCRTQRIFMYPLSGFLFLSLIYGDEKIYRYVLPFSLLGMFIATYHYAMQWDLVSSKACFDMTCGSRYMSIFGFITIPFQSLAAFILINTLMVLQWKKSKK